MATSNQGDVIKQGADRLETFLASVVERQRAYEKAIHTPTDPAAPSSPDDLCHELLESVGKLPFESFVTWVEGLPQTPRFLLALVATFAAQRRDWDATYAWAKRAMAMDNRDTYVQRLYVTAWAHKGDKSAETYDDLSDRFCHHPWEDFEITTSGNIYTCCPAWVPVAIGNIHRQTADEIWNSSAAQEIRRSILDGDYRHCSRTNCPILVRGKLPRREEVKNPEHQRILRERLTKAEHRPYRVTMSQDRSCNLSCPSCRTKMIVARKEEQDRLNELAETTIFPLIADARYVTVTGSGDPFGSAHFRYVLKRINRREFPNLRLRLQTNGVLLDERAWKELELEGLVESIWVSIDAGTPETYAILRRGGDWDRLIANLAFMGRLLREERVRFVRLDYVLQALNFRELPLAVAIAREHGLSVMRVQMIRNWGTYSLDEFASHYIGDPDHPDHAEFLEILTHPDVQPPFVDYSDMQNHWRTAPHTAGQRQGK